MPLSFRAFLRSRPSGLPNGSGIPCWAFVFFASIAGAIGDKSSYRVCASLKGPRRVPHLTTFNTRILSPTVRVRTSCGQIVLLGERIFSRLTRAFPDATNFWARERDLVWRANHSHLSIRICSLVSDKAIQVLVVGFQVFFECCKLCKW